MTTKAVRYTQPLLGAVPGTDALVQVDEVAEVLIRQAGVACTVYGSNDKAALANPVTRGVAPGDPGLSTRGELLVYLEAGRGYDAVVTVGAGSEAVVTVVPLPDVSPDVDDVGGGAVSSVDGQTGAVDLSGIYAPIADVTAEAAARAAADSALATAVNARALATDLTAEASARAAGDTTEATARAAAIAALSDIYVPLAGAATISGQKDFTTAPTVNGAPIGGTSPDATTSVKGLVKLAGDLAGTAALPTVPGVATNAAAIIAEAVTARAAEGANATAIAAETTRATTQEGLKLAKASNLSDLASAPIARTNLGLGTAAAQDSTAFDAAGAAGAAVAAIPADGSAGTASLRTLGAGALQAAPGTAPGDLAYQFAFGAGPTGVIKPWHVPITFGPELWQTANFRTGITNGNSTSLTPTLTGNGTSQTMRTLVSVGTIQEDMVFRIKGRINTWPTVGGGIFLRARLVDSSGAAIAGSNAQTLAAGTTYNWAGTDFEFEFKPSNLAGVGAFIDVWMQIGSGVVSGSMSLSNMSVKETTGESRPMLYADGATVSVSGPILHQQVKDPATGRWQDVRTDLGADGALTKALGAITVYDGPSPWRYPPADPLMLAATGADTDPIASSEEQAVKALARSARVTNNDQIMDVQKADLSFEPRCNTHGGETLITAASPNLVYEVDLGDGTWVAWNGTGTHLRTCRRFRYTYNTQIARSAPDSDVFATTTHVCTFFPDGVMRMDRTTTFTKAVVLRSTIEWMSSHDTSTPKIGRMGAGHLTTDEVDIYTKAAVPAAATAATSTIGGVLPAATYTYTYTDLTEGGETTPATVVTQATTGATSTVTLTMPAVPSGVTGRRIYGRASGVMRQVLLVTLGPVTSWVDDGSIAATGAQPPRVNTARRFDQPTSIALDSALSDSATWAVWKDLPTGMCFANIFDRDAVLGRSGVVGARTKLEAGSGIVKNYILVVWPGGTTLGGSTAAIPGGTVWTATHWCMTYLPADQNGRWEQEVADRAAFLSSLKTLYPAT